MRALALRALPLALHTLGFLKRRRLEQPNVIQTEVVSVGLRFLSPNGILFVFKGPRDELSFIRLIFLRRTDNPTDSHSPDLKP